MKAIWNGEHIAESNDAVVLDGNRCFPEDPVKREFYIPSNMHTIFHWKGEASYYSVVANGNED
jgi:uncharacterized protein (DUF427 family)